MLHQPNIARSALPDQFHDGHFRLIEKALAEKSLLDFVRLGWSQVESGPFSSNWHIEAICDHLEAVSRRQIKRLIINLPPRHMKPISENALVWEERRGHIALKEIEVGDRILTHRGRFRAVMAVHKQGVLPLLRVASAAGRSTLAAPDHPFLTTRGWIEARHLVAGDELAHVKPGTPLVVDPLVSVVPEGEGECRCLTVDEDHSFTADDLVVHNSLAANVFWPAWNWAQDTGIDLSTGKPYSIIPKSWLGAGTKFTYLSYQQELTTRDSISCRRLIDSPWYQDLFGDRFRFSHDENRTTKFTNSRGGHRLSLSIQGKITGEGADVFVIDDPHNVKDMESRVLRESTLRVWDEALPTRLNDPNWSPFVIIMQRTHERDLCGHILAKELGWTHLCLPAEYEPDHPFQMKTSVKRRDGRVWSDPRQPGEPLWKSRFTPTVLKEWKGRMSSYAVAGQLQQRPAPREGGLFKLSWFADRYVEAVPANAERVRAWDLAGTEGGSSDPDWTVGVKMAKSRDGLYYVEDVIRLRGSPHEVKQMIRATAELDEARHGRCHIRIPQDPGQIGRAHV